MIGLTPEDYALSSCEGAIDSDDIYTELLS